MKTITLERVVHNGGPRLALSFSYDKELIGLVKSLSDARWSKSMGYWHIPDNDFSLRNTLSLLNGHVYVDFSSISVSPAGEMQPEKDNQTGNLISSGDVGEKAGSDPLPDKGQEDQNRTNSNWQEERRFGYGAVIFTIDEADGRLIVRFSGKYDKDWIRELREYGKPYYDSDRKEWLLRWSQLAVDSLSDYFSARGVEVIVRKSKVPEAIKGIRQDLAFELHSREPGVKAKNYIDLVAGYLEEKRYSKRTIDAYLAHLGLFFRYFSDRDPDEISSGDVSRFLNEYIIGSGYSVSYQNILISAIKMFFKLAGKGKLDSDEIRRPRKGRALPKVLSKEEVMRIFSATRNSKHKLMLWLIYSCGLRRSEVINIKLVHLDRDRGVLQIREGKGNVDRVVPIPQKVWDKIDIYIKSYNPVTYLFEGQYGGKYSVESVYSVFKQSMKRAGINKDVGVHSLRHSYATHLHEGGLDIRYIQELLGHKSSRTTEIYTHVSRRNLFAIRSPIEDMDLE